LYFLFGILFIVLILPTLQCIADVISLLFEYIKSEISRKLIKDHISTDAIGFKTEDEDDSEVGGYYYCKKR